MPTRNNNRLFHAFLMTAFAVALCSVTVAAQVSQSAPAPNRSITAPAPQAHQPQQGRQPLPPGTSAPRPIMQPPGAGSIQGFVYWDTSVFTHTPASSCDGLSLTVSVENGLGGPFKGGFAALPMVTNNFKYVGHVKTFLYGGKTLTYDVCTYAYDHLPVGPQLKVEIGFAVVRAFSPIAVPQPSILGPITIINGKCNMLPHTTNPTLSDLTNHWSSCQNMAMNVNFVLQPGKILHTQSATGGGSSPSTQGAMLSSAPRQGMLAPGNTQSAQSPTNSGTLLGNHQSTPGQSGGVQNPGSKVELNPQPFPPKMSVRVQPNPAAQAAPNPRGLPTAATGSSSAKLGVAAAPIHVVLPGVGTTNFNPKVHGFHFRNDFLNDVVPVADVRTGGLCGGMSYTVLDYYFAHMPIPKQDYRPANRTALQSYIYNREVDSLASNLDKWAEVGFNPGGSRNGEFFNWGLQGTNGGRLQELRSFIDKGTPAVLDLQGDGDTGNHQMVAIGYSMGRYQGDLKNFESDLKIIVVDPNYPLQTKTLIPDVAHQLYRYEDGTSERWRTYFVDKNYHPKTPPNLPNPKYPADGTIRELILSFHTGDDDLRGGKDNINLTLNSSDGTKGHVYPNINLGAPWLPNYTESARVVLTKPMTPQQIGNLTFTDTFGGGTGGDNWDMQQLKVRAIGGNLDEILQTAGFKRFTGDDKQLVVSVNP
jgi:hypothetical protein